MVRPGAEWVFTITYELAYLTQHFINVCRPIKEQNKRVVRSSIVASALRSKKKGDILLFPASPTPIPRFGNPQNTEKPDFDIPNWKRKAISENGEHCKVQGRGLGLWILVFPNGKLTTFKY